MKKNSIIISFLFILTSCFGGKNIENEKNIPENKVNTENTGSYSTGVIEKLGSSEKEVVENFYSNNSENQKNIQEWLVNEENHRTSKHGDIIEFLDYCEKFKKEVKNDETLLEFLYNIDEKGYMEIFGTKGKDLSSRDISKNILKSLEEVDKAGIYYQKMFKEYFDGINLECKKYINE